MRRRLGPRRLSRPPHSLRSIRGPHLVQQTYGYEIHRFEAIQNDEVKGILVLTHVHHPIFGNYLTTSPFGSYGGFAYLSAEARDALLEEARRLGE